MKTSILSAGLAVGAALLASPVSAEGLAGAPAPFDKGGVEIAGVSFLGSGDWLQAFEAGTKRQAEALGVTLTLSQARNDNDTQRNLVEQAINRGVKGIIINNGRPEVLKDVAQKALDAGIKVVAYDVDLDNPAIPQIEQNDRELARLALEQAIADNGESFKAGYVYVPGIAPLDRRDETWQAFKKKYPGIQEVAHWGTMNNPIANSVADQTAAVLRANPDITVIFAPYDEFAKGAKTAVDEAGLSEKIKIYSADISTPDISAMVEDKSAWAASAATSSAVVGEVCVRTLALQLAGVDTGAQVVVPPTLITRQMLLEKGIKNMDDLAAKLPQFSKADVSMAPWIPEPKR